LERLINELLNPRPHNYESSSMLTALGNTKPAHLVDHKLFDFKNLKAGTGNVESELDLAVGHTHEDLQPALVSIM